MIPQIQFVHQDDIFTSDELYDIVKVVNRIWITNKDYCVIKTFQVGRFVNNEGYTEIGISVPIIDPNGIDGVITDTI